MAIKKKVVKKETAKPSKKVSKKPTSKPVKKKAAPRGNPVKKASISTMIVQIIENPIKGIGASVSINIQGDKTALIAGIIATMNEKSDISRLHNLERSVGEEANEQCPRENGGAL